MRPSGVSDLNGLQVVILPLRAPLSDNHQYFNAAYALWKDVWKSTLLELDGSDELYSDHFTRQDYAVALFHGPICAAMVCFRRANLSLEAHQQDSWFKPWPTAMIQEIGQKWRNGLVISWLTINPIYRRSAGDEYLRNLDISSRLAEMLCYFVQDCGVEIAYGVSRNNRSVDKFCLYSGSKSLLSGATLHGVDVDLMGWFPESMAAMASQYPEFSRILWQNRKVFLDKPLVVSEIGPAKGPVLRVA